MGALVPLLHPVVAEFVDALGPVAVEELTAHLAGVDAGAGVDSVDVAAQVELGGDEDPAKDALPLLDARLRLNRVAYRQRVTHYRFHRDPGHHG